MYRAGWNGQSKLPEVLETWEEVKKSLRFVIFGDYKLFELAVVLEHIAQYVVGEIGRA